MGAAPSGSLALEAFLATVKPAEMLAALRSMLTLVEEVTADGQRGGFGALAAAPALTNSAKLLQLYGTKYSDLSRLQMEASWTAGVEVVAQELLVAVRSAEMLRAVFNEEPQLQARSPSRSPSRSRRVQRIPASSPSARRVAQQRLQLRQQEEALQRERAKQQRHSSPEALRRLAAQQQALRRTEDERDARARGFDGSALDEKSVERSKWIHSTVSKSASPGSGSGSWPSPAAAATAASAAASRHGTSPSFAAEKEERAEAQRELDLGADEVVAVGILDYLRGYNGTVDPRGPQARATGTTVALTRRRGKASTAWELRVYECNAAFVAPEDAGLGELLDYVPLVAAPESESGFKLVMGNDLPGWSFSIEGFADPPPLEDVLKRDVLKSEDQNADAGGGGALHLGFSRQRERERDALRGQTKASFFCASEVERQRWMHAFCEVAGLTAVLDGVRRGGGAALRRRRAPALRQSSPLPGPDGRTPERMPLALADARDYVAEASLADDDAAGDAGEFLLFYR